MKTLVWFQAIGLAATPLTTPLTTPSPATQHSAKSVNREIDEADRQARLTALPHVVLNKAYRVSTANSRAEAGEKMYFFEMKLIGGTGQKFRVSIDNEPGQYPSYVNIRSWPREINMAEIISRFNGKVDDIVAFMDTDAEKIGSKFDAEIFSSVTASSYDFKLKTNGDHLLIVGQNVKDFLRAGAEGSAPPPYTLRVERIN